MSHFTVTAVSLLLLATSACSKEGAGATSSPLSPSGQSQALGQRFVTVGFWQNSSCVGEPTGTTAFPVDFGDTQCFSWSGRSGTNSASRFACGQGNTFSYTQWTTLNCSGGQVPEGTRKVVAVTSCNQGVPITQYARILDFSGCQ